MRGWLQTIMLAVAFGAGAAHAATGQVAVGEGSNWPYSSMAQNPVDGVAYGMWRRSCCGTVSYNLLRWNGSNFAAVTNGQFGEDGALDIPNFDSGYDYVSLAIDSAGGFHVAFSGSRGNALTGPRGIFYAYRTATGTTWTFSEVETASHPNGWRNFTHPKVQVDSANRPHIAYQFSDVSLSPRVHKVRYAYFNGSAWAVRDAFSQTGDNNEVGDTDIAIDSNAKAHVIFQAEINGSGLDGVLYYTNNTASAVGGAFAAPQALATGGTNAPEGNSMSIVVDAANRVHLVHQNSQGRLTYLNNVSGSFTSAWINNSLIGGLDGDSLSRNASGTLYLTYQDGLSLKYAYLPGGTGSTWTTGNHIAGDFDTANYFSGVITDSGAFYALYDNGNSPRNLWFASGQTTAALPSVSISVSPASVTENGSGNLTYTVTRSAASASSLVVNLSTAGTATAGTDYTGNAATVTIAANMTAATLTINPTGDTTIEPDETVRLTVASGTGYTVGTPSSATGTITNDDFPSVSVAVNPASVAENGSANLVYTFTLSQAALSPLSVVYTISGTATNGTDYTAIASPLAISTGLTSATVTVNPTSDPTTENDETVILSVQAGSGYSVGTPNSATGTILNDDVPTVTAPTSTAVTSTSATLGGTVSSAGGATITQRGIVLSITGTNGDPLIGGAGVTNLTTSGTTGVFTLNATSLTPNTAYSFKAYATNGAGTGYTSVATFTTACLPTVVTNGNDSGAGSLRQVIADACAGSTITFQAGITTVSLTSAELSIGKSLSIEGATGVTITRAAGSPDFRIFRILAGNTVSMNAVTISNGRVTGNGGGILNQGALTLTNSTLSGNHASDDGGGIDSLNAPVSIIGSTLSGNSAGRFAAAVFRNSAATLRNCTVVGNTAPDTGGLGFDGGAPATVTNCSVVGNTSVAIVVAISDRPTSTLTLVNTVVAMPGSLAMSGVVSLASSNNLIQASPGFGAGGMVDGVDGNIVSTANLRVGSLGNFGGSTQTVALLPGSPAINAGTATGAPATDQRGIARVGNVDIGAFESRGFAMAISGGNNQSAEINTAFANPLAVTVSSAFGEPVAGGGVTFTPPSAGASAVLTGSPATISGAGAASVAAAANGNAGSYAVAASATGATGVNFSLQNTAPPNSDLSITLTDSPDPVVTGGTLTYTLTVSNGGSDAILTSQSFSIRSSLPAGLSGCSFTPSGGTFSVGTIAPGATGTGTWTGVALAAPVGTATLTIVCSVSASAATSLSHTATVFPPTGILDPDCSGVPLDCAGTNTATTATAVTRPQLTLMKTASGATFTAGTPASFTLQLSNTGTAATTAVSTITDTIPSGLTIGTLPAGCTPASQTVSCTVPAGLAASGSASFVIPVTATVSAATSVTNTATVSGGGDPTCPANARCTSSVTVAIGGTCATVSFPYTLVGGDNATRIANLRTAIQCANLNGSADLIDLNGQTLTVTNAFADYSGATALPEITSVLTLRSGTLLRDSGAPQFRFLAMNAAADLVLDGITLQGGNLATGTAGAIRNLSGDLTLINSSVTGNSAEFSGAIYHEIGALTIIDSVLSGNTTGRNGILTNGEGTVTIIDSTLSGNTQSLASNSAGVLFNFHATAIVLGSTFSGNSTGGGGGAIHNFFGTVHIANSAFAGNTASSVGGALFNNNGTMTVANSRITGNTAGNLGGGLRNQGGSLTVSNSTIAGNSAPADGGITAASGTSTLVNSILWGNSTTSTLTGATVSYSIVEGGAAGTGNLDADPLFVAPVGFASAPTSTGDYRLQSYSPATDAGSNAAVPLDAFDVNGNANTTEEAPDLDGNPRRTNDTGIADTGAGTAPIVDLGAYERQTNSVVVAATVAPTGLSVSEVGSTVDSFVLSLNAAPTSNVTVQLSFDGNVAVDAGSGFGASPQTVTLTPANAMSGVTVNVRAVDDAIVEASPHTAPIVTSATSSTNPGFNGLAVADVTVSISDNDTAGIVVTETAGNTMVTEGGAGDSYNVVLTSQPTANVNVNMVFDPGQIVVGGETDGSVSLQFTPADWSTAKTVSVAAVDDTLVESNPHASPIVQTASSDDPLYNVINPADVSVSIAENDTQEITFALASSSVGETAGTHAVNARLNLVTNGTPGGTISAAMTANVFLVLGSAEIADLSLATTQLTFPAGSAHNSTLPINLTLVNDRLLEGDETGTLNFGLVGSIGSVSGTHVVTLTDDESGAISFRLPNSATNESAGTYAGVVGRLTINGTGTGPLASEASVSVAITDAPGTATTPADYTRSTSTLVFPANAPSPVEQPISVSIANDVLIENVEDFSLGFGAISGAGALSAAGTHVVGIVDNDLAQVAFAPGNDSVGEGAGSFAKPVTLTLTANGVGTASLQNAIVVPVSFTEGTALEPDDFTLATVSVSFAAGSLNGATQNVSASLVDDAVSEAAESFDLNLGNGFVTSNITLGRAATTVSIVDNDTPGVTVTQSDGTTLVTEGGATDSFTVVLTSQPTANVTVALTGSQVTPAPTPLTFTSANWNVAQPVTVTAIDDAIDEASPHAGSVSFLVTSGDSSYNEFPVSPVGVQVSDNDSAGVTVIELDGNTAVTEGGATDTYTIALTSEPTANVAVVLGVGAQASVSPPNLSFTAANWNVAQTVTVSATNDTLVEGPTTESITHSTSSTDSNYSGIAVAGVSVAITDNDSATVQFAPATVSQAEGSSPMAFTVTLSNPVASGVTLNLNSAFGTALAADFTPISGATVSFPASSTAPQTVNVVIANDALDEDNETFSLTLTNLIATGDVTLGTATAGGTIVDDDATPVISITSPSQPEGNAGTTPMNFVVSLSAISGRDVTFMRATTDGTALVGDNDYQPLALAPIIIGAGQSGITLTVQIVGDTASEANETFNLDLTNIVNATVALPPGIEGSVASLTGTGTIEDDDQQPTTTTITSHTPDPTVVGQPYTVSVNVAAVRSSPLGTVTISDGAVSCGPVALTTATSPNSTASCALTSTTAGAKTLTATYAPANTAFADSVSVGVPHQVNAAGTTISVSGPPRSRINTPTTFTFALSVSAPGAGTPAGTVTLSSGTHTCNVPVPTMTPSCALTFDTLGLRTVSAAFAPSNGNFLGSTSSGSQNAQTLVFALSDIAVTKSDGVGTFRPGDLMVYTVTVRNLGDDAAAQIRVIDNVPAGLVDVVWTCDASGGVACPQAGGSGNLDLTIASFPVGGLLNFTFYGNVDGSPAQLVNTALVQLPADTMIEDPDSGNNSATDTNLLELLFKNGFEAVAVNAPNGSFRLPSATLRGALDELAVAVYGLDDANGEALRVYARVMGNDVEYALATRNAQGQLRLGNWAGYDGDPLLTWTARPVADGWVLDSAGLR
jgi:uncharacterized repeat protein (TIGR01451 family)